MLVDSFNMEFGYELLSAVPYAYEQYLKGRLTETRSAVDTAPLYYFSPKHTINPSVRGWHNINVARRGGLPYTFIHQPEQPDKTFPPYKEVYANKLYKFKKPTLCICNRKNTEWNVEAINFFDEEILDWLFEHLKDQYEIVYFPVNIPVELQDNVEPHHLEDIAVAKKHGVRLFTEMREGKSWNDTLLRVFANCEHFITMNGGYSILASIFSGTNIIYSKPGYTETREIKNGSFWRWYPNINNVRTLHVPSYEELKAKVRTIYIEQKPRMNILVRTHRPNYLKNCIASIKAQTYDNINLVLICDSKKAVEYTRAYEARMVQVSKQLTPPEKPTGEDYGIFFPYNAYLSKVQKLVQGYIMFLDDDDKLTDTQSVERIIAHCAEDAMTLWRVDFNGGRLIPGDSFGKEVTLYDVTGIGLAYHSSQIKHTDWSEWKRADYRTAKKLSKALKTVWVDEVLTGLQDRAGMGTKPDIPDAPSQVKVKMTYPGGRIHFQTFSVKEFNSFAEHFKRQGICIEQTI